jgi:hypothetical protein
MLRVTLISVARVAAEQQAPVTIVQKTSGLWARDLVAHAMRGCSMKRKSIIFDTANLWGCATTRTRAPL